MARIENIDHLRKEIVRLKKLTGEQEVQLRADFENVKEDMKPMNLLLRGLSSITGIGLNKNVFMKDGVFYGFSLLLQRLVLKAEKKAEETVYKFVDVLFDKIQDFVSKHTSHDARKEERRENGQD